MGWRYRKSINLGGGFRVNLSKSGIGYSWGVKGYRITKTADGRTRHTASIPGTGISYVEEHGKKRPAATSSAPKTDPLSEYSGVQRIVSAGADSLRSPEYDQLFSQIKRIRLLCPLLVILAILTIPTVVVSLACIIGFFILFAKGRCSIIYEFDDDEADRWDRVSSAWRSVAGSQSLQEITLTAQSKNTRRTAGIENAIDTVKMTAGSKLPWYLKTNIKPVVFNFKSQQVAIMPDRLLVFSKKEFGALDYEDVNFDISAIGYLEGGPVPKDSELVKMVWAHQNNDGTPDRRYSGNKQFPILKFGKIVMTSASGLNIQFICSNEAAADALNTVLNGPSEG